MYKKKLREMKFKLILNIDGNNYGDPIKLTLMIKSIKFEEFRKEFNYDKNKYDDAKLLALLQKYKFNKEVTFYNLFNK